jgi:hypothetical protein
VALSGEDANAGLPGLYDGSRKALHQTETVQGLRMTYRMPRVFEVKAASSWGSCARIYQEEHLSARLLFFSNCQYLLNCDHMCYREDIELFEGVF